MSLLKANTWSASQIFIPLLNSKFHCHFFLKKKWSPECESSDSSSRARRFLNKTYNERRLQNSRVGCWNKIWDAILDLTVTAEEITDASFCSLLCEKEIELWEYIHSSLSSAAKTLAPVYRRFAQEPQNWSLNYWAPTYSRRDSYLAYSDL